MARKSDSSSHSPTGAALLPTNLKGVFSFAPRGKSVDLRKADLRTLLRHGIPPRPKGRESASAARLWDRIMARPLRHIHPHLSVLNAVKPPPGMRKRKSARSKRDVSQNSDMSSTVWSGGVVTPAGHRLVTVYANWVIPTVLRPAGAPDSDGPWKSVTWVGLDGEGSADVLQAGTTQMVEVADDWDSDDPDNITYYAWYEWFPDFEVKIDNFPVNAGDAMFVYVRFEGPDAAAAVNYGSAWLVNLTTGIETSIYFPEPGATATFTTGFLGNSAECITEQPSFTDTHGNSVQFNFVHFGEVAFVNFGACADDQTLFTAADLTTLGLMNGLSDGEHSAAIVCQSPG